jgi:hypothetical protein
MMNTKATKMEKLLIGLCIGLLICLTFTIAVRFLTRQILVEHFSMDNAFTQLVWFDNADAAGVGQNEEGANAVSEISTNWAEQYPFDDSKSNLHLVDTKESSNTTNVSILNRVDQVTSAVAGVEGKMDVYATDLLIFYSKITEGAYAYEKYIGWNFASFVEYNAVVQLSDGYLTSYVSKQNTTQYYEALAELNEFCQDEGINFLYIQAPYKISEYDDTDVSGTVDFSNQNADELLEQLDSAGIDYYDIRETIHENDLRNHDLFYKTDHHWLTTTGLWAAQNILAFCNSTYGWNADLSLLDADQFDYVTYEDWFLGSRGKKVTLSRCQPDDFTLLYPKYSTSFSYYVPAEGIDTIGDYSVVYDMSQIEECDYYNKNPYGGCNYADQPLIQIENQLTADEHKILIIGDSFDNCVISCLALAEKNVDSLDLRHFTGSVKSYIEESQPDIVMVMYHAGAVGGDIDYSTHKDEFDFR